MSRADRQLDLCSPIDRAMMRAPSSTAQVIESFFLAYCHNAHTRRAYRRAVATWIDHCERHQLHPLHARPAQVAAHIEALPGSTRTKKARCAALRSFFRFLAEHGEIVFNPASELRAPRLSARTGETRGLSRDEARALLDALDARAQRPHVTGHRWSAHRNAAFVATMLYTWARIGTIQALPLDAIETDGGARYIRLEGKRGRVHRMPIHSRLAPILERWLSIRGDRPGLLFPTRSAPDRPTPSRTIRAAILSAAKRAGIVTDGLCPHSLRVTAITNYLANGGDIAKAARMAGHADPSTTRLYDRNDQEATLAEVERVNV